MQASDQINRSTYSKPTDTHRLPPQLRQGGLYRLPDGTEVVVGVGRQSHYFLYHPRLWNIQAWIVSLPVYFEIRDDGFLITGKGNPTDWSIHDLIDTGITAEKMRMS